MANLLRTAKNHWSLAELHAYNITVKWQDTTTFFGVNSLPQPAVPRELLKKVAANDMVNDTNYKLLHYMDLATDPDFVGQDSAVDGFAVHLLTVLGYVPRPRIARTHAAIPLTSCHQKHYVTTDICIIDADDSILLLIQKDKQHKKPRDPEAQLIAGAIAAFQTHNYRQTHILGQNPILHKVVPGITLNGTSPIFYKIPVTTQLAQSVALGIYPAEPTIVHAHIPQVADPTCCPVEAMKALDNRRTIFSCYEAFKRFVN
ncbi:hypothetical protein EDB83DRAFT_2282911 [Lactarius deliciosus]|nr:hypothetical protein EDB83DRAFT_2282911 [Lactarius deliciosus]